MSRARTKFADLSSPEGAPWESEQYAELVAHLSQMSRLSPQEARRVLSEICAYFDEPVQSFVSRRHVELRADGYHNAAIYRRIAEELPHRRFPAPRLSERQIRRLIYG